MDAPSRNEWIFLKLLAPFAAGIALAYWFPLPANTHWPIGIGLGMLTLLLWVAHSLQKPLPNNQNKLWAFIVYSWMAFAGLLNTHWANPALHPQHYSHSNHVPGALVVQLEENPIIKTTTYQAIASVKSKLENNQLKPQTGKVLLLLPIDSLAARLRYGDELVVNAKLQKIEGAKNPYEFDYQQYMAQKHLYYQLKAKPYKWYATGANKGKWHQKLLLATREYALAILKGHLPQPDNFAVAAAILIGHKGNIDPETRKVYSVTGSMHVLAVSGMHIGLLYFMLAWVLIPLKLFKKVWLRLAVLLAIMWFYALLTGFSPSAVRATLMFSLFALGDSIKRRPNSLNIWAGSALLLLAFEPMQLFDVGFQLSYLAVAGILFFYRPLVNLWPIKNRLLNFLWSGTCISIAAQITTLPLILCYFHQLPVYTLLANLGMLFLAPAVMFVGLLLLLLYWVPVLGLLLGKVLWASVWLMNGTLAWIAALPNAAWRGFYPTLAQTVLLFAAIACGIGATQIRRPIKPFIGIATLGIALLALNNHHLYLYKQQQQLIVYCYPEHTALATFTGTQGQIWIDRLALNDTAKMERSIYPYIHAQGINVLDTIVLPKPKANSYGAVGNRTFAILRKYKRRNIPKQALAVDYLILSANPAVNMLQITRVYNTRHIIIDASNNAKTAQRWMQECKVLGIECHNTRNGAFIASW